MSERMLLLAMSSSYGFGLHLGFVAWHDRNTDAV